MCGIAFHATQRVSAQVTRGRAVIGYGNGSHQVQVLVAFGREGRAMPDSGDHRGTPCVRVASKTFRCRKRAIAPAIWSTSDKYFFANHPGSPRSKECRVVAYPLWKVSTK